MSGDATLRDQVFRLKTAGQQYIDGELSYQDFEEIIKEPVAAVNSYDEARMCVEWALAEAEGRTRYEIPEQREACIERLRTFLEKTK